MKRKLPEWRTQKCNPCFGAESPLRSTGLQTAGFHTSPYRAVSENLRKLGATLHRGTVFAPMQSIYEKEVTWMENPKMLSLFWCRKPTSQYGLANYRLSCIAVYGRPCKFAETRRIPFTVVPWLHQCNLCMERKLLEWRTQKCNPCFGAESPLRSTGLQTTGFHASPYRAVSVNLRKLGATFHRGTVFASMQSIYEKEAAGMENPKM